MNVYCKPCQDKGHFCPAREGSEHEEGGPQCIFCEDGEPCPVARQKPTALASPRLLAEDEVKVRRQKEGVTEVVPTNYRLPRKKEKLMETKPVVRSARTCICGCGGVLNGRWPYLKGHNKPNGTPFVRHCTVCGEKLHGMNKTGLCAKHKKTRPKSWEAFKAKKANGNGHTIAGGGEHGLVALRVNEQQLNDFILRLPIEHRAEMVNAWLAGS